MNHRSNFKKYFVLLSTLFIFNISLFSSQLAHAKSTQQIISIESIDDVVVSDMLAQKNADTVELTLSSNGKKFELTLKPNKTLLEKLKRSDDSTLVLYKGEVNGMANSWVRLSDNDGVYSGAIYDGKELYFVDPATALQQAMSDTQFKRFAIQADDTQVLYKASDVSNSGLCGTENHNQSTANFNYQNFVNELNVMANSLASREIEVALVADTEFNADYNGNAANRMLIEMNVVDGIFSEQVNVQLSVVSSSVLTDNGTLTMTDAAELVYEFRDFVFDQVGNPGVTHLFTGKELNSNTIGIAFVAELCTTYGVGVTQNVGSSTALVAAHEVGHNFGAPHDNQSGSACSSTTGNYLMSPSINGSDQFSSCSIAQMDNHIDQANRYTGNQCIVDIVTTVAPTITSTPEPNATAGIAYQYDENNTLEADGSGNLVFNLDFGPDGMQVSGDGIVSWQPNAQQVGLNPVQVTVNSPYGTDSQSFNVDVSEQPNGDFIDFNAQPITSFDPKQGSDGSVTTSLDGSSITLQGNRWVKIAFNYVVTPNTFIEFDYISTAQGEIHGIGLQSANKIDARKTFKLFGSQSWGIPDVSYTQIGQVQRIRIPLGEYYRGTMNYLFMVMDNDVANPNSNGTFSNVTVYESQPETEPGSSIDFTQYTISTYGSNQNPSGDGIVEILDAGNSLHLQGNLWRKIEINQTLTATSVLEFEFKSNTEGEIHGIGFGDSNGVDAKQTFKLFGIQNWGIADFSYTGDGDFQKIVIPIGKYYQGDFRYLFFSMDNDVPNPGSGSVFKNVVIK